MEAREGVLFLLQLLQSPQSAMTADDLEEAIRLAGQYSPSASFDRAGRYYRLAHFGVSEMEILAFAKGVRWLAVVRRDEGTEAFEAVASKLRGAAGYRKCPSCQSVWRPPVSPYCNCGENLEVNWTTP